MADKEGKNVEYVANASFLLTTPLKKIDMGWGSSELRTNQTARDRKTPDLHSQIFFGIWLSESMI